jgi:tRNA-Thr(GGU) m(6)t(6)A37 methyltransferase TsaA
LDIGQRGDLSYHQGDGAASGLLMTGEKKDHFSVFPIGAVRRSPGEVFIDVTDSYAEALMGLEGFSHIVVLSWLDKNDTPQRRRTLKVHPRNNPENPLAGVFATRSPLRPNPIALSTCKILRIEPHRIFIDKIDAFDGTPVLDIKPCITDLDFATDIKIPDWARRLREED